MNKGIFADDELQETATVRNFRIVQTKGGYQVSRVVMNYNLQMIIVVDFKVNHDRTVQFHKWTNGVAKGYTPGLGHGYRAVKSGDSARIS